MFHFAMDKRRRYGLNSETLINHGIFPDPSFGREIAAAWLAEHPAAFFEESKAHREYARLFSLSQYYRIDYDIPKLDDAVKIVKSAFFHPPMDIWINGKHYHIS